MQEGLHQLCKDVHNTELQLGLDTHVLFGIYTHLCCGVYACWNNYTMLTALWTQPDCFISHNDS